MTNDKTAGESDRAPILFIPGIFGSRLYTEDGGLVWSSLAGLAHHADQLPADHALTVKNNFENQNNLRAAQREGGATGMYHIVLNHLCAAFPDREIYFFSYDFRQSCADSAARLQEEIEFVQNGDAARRVDIIAHSMGGLVVSSYVEQHGTDSFHKIITLGTPYAGIPDGICAVTAGNFFGFPRGLVEKMGITRELVSQFPGVADLLPSAGYQAAHPFIEAAGQEMKTEDADKLLVRIFGDQYTACRQRIASRIAEGTQKMAEFEGVYVAAGTNHSTITSVLYAHGEVKAIRSKDGDGVVPYDSAVMFGLFEGPKRDAKGRERFVSFGVRHNALLLMPECVQWITEILR